MSSKDEFYGLTRNQLLKILDNLYNEVYVTDENQNVIYVNPACKRHYGLSPEEMIGQNNNDLALKYWSPCVSPMVYQNGNRIIAKQKTYYGQNITSIVNPVKDSMGKVKMVISVVQENIENYDMSYSVQEEEIDLNNLVERFENKESFDIISDSKCMSELMKTLFKVADTEINVLLLGETGTGKTVLAKYIHENSRRAGKTFLSINCAAIPESLLESELFGYTPYAFTGASPQGKTGLVELADKGTLFLDEIGELSISMQSRLLELIENKRYMMVGSQQHYKTDVRIICATNQDLKALVRLKAFREDLYWRLNILEVTVPSLSERKNDIVPLSNYFLNFFNNKYKMHKNFTKDAENIIEYYDWPGNVRHLKNFVERIILITDNQSITEKDVLSILQPIDDFCEHYEQGKTLEELSERFKKELISKTFLEYGSSRKLARMLNMSQSTANRLINKYCSGRGGY